jgi:hypothetical protein
LLSVSFSPDSRLYSVNARKFTVKQIKIVKRPAAANGTHFFWANAGVLLFVRFARLGVRRPGDREMGARLLSE